MNKNVVFTICAKNYIGLAQILESSIKKNNSDVDFYIFVADEFGDNWKDSLPSNVYIAKDVCMIEDELWKQMAFKYNLTEFCTAIKPYCFKYFEVNTNYDKYVYFDPDVYTFDSLDCIFDNLSKYSIVLTPHISNIQTMYSGELAERMILGSGVFNLGFCALHRDEYGRKFIYWWEERLKYQCFIDSLDNYFTDQRWIDFLPCFFDSGVLYIDRSLGLNIAPWNFFEREVYYEGEELYVKLRNNGGEKRDKLIFVHYSGYDYSKLKQGIIVQRNISNLQDYNDIKIITEVYKDAIIRQVDVFNRFITQEYSYNFFDNGIKIELFHRRLYRNLIDKGELFCNPFSIDSDSLYKRLKNKYLLSNKHCTDIDKMSISSASSLKRLLNLFNLFSICVFKIFGYRRYLMLLRLLRQFSRYESQIHLIDKKYISDNLR